MILEPRTHTLGPRNATLAIRTGKAGAASKAGHNLLLEVTSWEGVLELGERCAVALTADAASLRVREATGGLQSLDDEDRAGIEQTIDEEVLKGTAIRLRSSEVEASPDGSRLSVRGELELAGRTQPLEFELTIGEAGRLTGSVTIKQSDWGIKPYSALFGTLKVSDEVSVAIEAKLD
jgi:hypothetical protein